MPSESRQLTETPLNAAGEAAVERIRSLIESESLPRGARLPSERTLAARLEIGRKALRHALAYLEAEGEIRATSPRIRVVEGGSGPASAILSSTFVFLSRGTYDPNWMNDPSLEDSYVLGQAAMRIREHGYHVFFLNTEALADGMALAAPSFRPKGILVAESYVDLPAIRKALESAYERGVPVALYGYPTGLDAFDAVVSDHERGGYELARWLLKQGRRRLLFAPLFPSNPQWIVDRYKGYARALQEAGLETRPALKMSKFDIGMDSPERFLESAKHIAGHLAEHLTGPHPVDGIMAATDRHTFFLSAACRQLHRDPVRDVCIVGYDNSFRHAPEGAHEPATLQATCDKHKDALGAALADLVMKRVSKELPDQPFRARLNPTLVSISHKHNNSKS